MSRTVLVIGATGILAPAVAALVARGDAAVAVSRHGGDGSIAVDARDVAALTAALARESWDDALVYAPAVTEVSLAFVRASTPGRTVVVRVSRSADPARGILIVPRDTLQLGWRPPAEPRSASTRAERQGVVAAEPSAVGEDRWHSPDEVSRAALEVLADGEPRTLGAVRPWSDRP